MTPPTRFEINLALRAIRDRFNDALLFRILAVPPALYALVGLYLGLRFDWPDGVFDKMITDGFVSLMLFYIASLHVRIDQLDKTDGRDE